MTYLRCGADSLIAATFNAERRAAKDCRPREPEMLRYAPAAQCEGAEGQGEERGGGGFRDQEVAEDDTLRAEGARGTVIDNEAAKAVRSVETEVIGDVVEGAGERLVRGEDREGLAESDGVLEAVGEFEFQRTVEGERGSAGFAEEIEFRALRGSAEGEAEFSDRADGEVAVDDEAAGAGIGIDEPAGGDVRHDGPVALQLAAVEMQRVVHGQRLRGQRAAGEAGGAGGLGVAARNVEVAAVLRLQGAGVGEARGV